jgi:hypothetical protein
LFWRVRWRRLFKMSTLRTVAQQVAHQFPRFGQLEGSASQTRLTMAVTSALLSIGSTCRPIAVRPCGVGWKPVLRWRNCQYRSSYSHYEISL